MPFARTVLFFAATTPGQSLVTYTCSAASGSLLPQSLHVEVEATHKIGVSECSGGPISAIITVNTRPNLSFTLPDKNVIPACSGETPLSLPFNVLAGDIRDGSLQVTYSVVDADSVLGVCSPGTDDNGEQAEVRASGCFAVMVRLCKVWLGL